MRGLVRSQRQAETAHMQGAYVLVLPSRQSTMPATGTCAQYLFQIKGQPLTPRIVMAVIVAPATVSVASNL